MINRFQYMADCTADICDALQADKAIAEQCIKSGDKYLCGIASMDRFEGAPANMDP